MASNKGSIRDQYANKFYGSVTESAANTLTFQEIQTNVNIFDKTAWVLHRIEWYPEQAAVIQLVAGTDRLNMALTASNNLTAVGLDQAAVIDLLTIDQIAVADSTGQQIREFPYIRDFTNLPGGGLIIAPRPLFIAAQGVSIASAITVRVRGYFTVVELSGDQYLDLVDFYRILA